jgi:hypothetical protein
MFAMGAGRIIGIRDASVLARFTMDVFKIKEMENFWAIMPSEIQKLLRNRWKALFLLGIIWKRQQPRTEALPALSFGCVFEIPRKIERPSGPTIA